MDDAKNDKTPWPPCASADDRERLLERLIGAGIDGAPPLIVCDGIRRCFAHELGSSGIRRYWETRFKTSMPVHVLPEH